jgi:Mg-chelatase subunit ChlD
MKHLYWLAAFALVGLVPVAAQEKQADKQPEKQVEKKVEKPKVEVVFCLDTTGSMGGLIEGAKAKIWAICNQIAGGKPTPDLKVGLVAFRDRGDEYVTKVFDLTDDLDAVYSDLKKFVAAGGGDIPESVNQALDDSVNKIKWSTDRKTLRIIFLVGDAPPHMDYKDDVKYPETCKKACEKGIIINTIQCGNDAECTKFWKDICVKAEGSYAKIAQDGGVTPVVSTPFDKRLAEINSELATNTLVYGRSEKQAADSRKLEEAKKLPAPAAAERAGIAGKGTASAPSYDLLEALKRKEVDLEKMDQKELPKELQGKTAEEQKEVIKKVEQKREELTKEAKDLDKKRNDFIAEEQKKQGNKDSFDTQVLQMLRQQAKKTGIDY